MTLTVFHYHLQPGGVTGVIAAAGSTAVASLEDIRRLRLVCGSPENAEAVAERLRESSDGNVPVELMVIPELGYQADIPVGKRPGLSSKLEGILSELSETEDVWWVHNHHLGKNPAFTDALLRFAEHTPSQRIVLQIHDFPESGRYENLAMVTEGVSEPLYPILPNLRYVVLNRRDFAILRSAGVPEGTLFLLPNPVRMTVPGTPKDSGLSRSEVSARLASIPGNESRRFVPDGRLVVYPVRCIRRKNVLEAALLTELASKTEMAGKRSSNGEEPRPWNLVVTLPGTSDQERRYSEMVQSAFEAGLVAGRFAPGAASDVPFAALMGAADAVISSSVQEGFGYTYIEAVASHHHLIARHIDILSGVDEMLRRYEVSFYQRVLVPFTTPSLSDIRPLLRLRYGERLDEVRPLLPADVFDALAGELEELLAGETIDFSFLMPQMQYTMLKDLEDEAFSAELSSLNSAILESFRGTAEAKHDLSLLEEEFGFDVYGRRLGGIIESFDGRQVEPGAADAGSVLSHFATIEYLRLLYAAM